MKVEMRWVAPDNSDDHGAVMVNHCTEGRIPMFLEFRTERPGTYIGEEFTDWQRVMPA